MVELKQRIENFVNKQYNPDHPELSDKSRLTIIYHNNRHYVLFGHYTYSPIDVIDHNPDARYLMIFSQQDCDSLEKLTNDTLPKYYGEWDTYNLVK